MLTLSLHSKLHVAFALLAMICSTPGVAIGDVTIDALGAQNIITHPNLAPDVQSLMGLSSSIGSLIGFSISGLRACYWISGSVWSTKHPSNSGSLSWITTQGGSLS